MSSPCPDGNGDGAVHRTWPERGGRRVPPRTGGSVQGAGRVLVVRGSLSTARRCRRSPADRGVELPGAAVGVFAEKVLSWLNVIPFCSTPVPRERGDAAELGEQPVEPAEVRGRARRPDVEDGVKSNRLSVTWRFWVFQRQSLMYGVVLISHRKFCPWLVPPPPLPPGGWTGARGLSGAVPTGAPGWGRVL